MSVGDRGEIDVALTKAEVEGPVGEAPAVADGVFAQAALAAEMVFELWPGWPAGLRLVVHVVAPSRVKERSPETVRQKTSRLCRVGAPESGA